MSVILLDRLMVHYEVLGRGRPILFLHGWVGSWRYWIPVMQSAAISFRTYAIDLWGFGDSSKEPSHYTLDQQVALLEAFMEEMGIMKMALVGHGLGSIVALKFATKHPEAVDRVMAVGYPLEDSMVGQRLRSATTAELADWLLSKSSLADSVRAEAPKADPQAVQSSLANLSGAGLQELWKGMKTPCLLAHGANDPAIQPPRAEQLNELPYMIHAIPFDQSGHFPMIDEDNKFIRLVADFLALHSGDSPRDLQVKEEWKRRVR